MHRPPVVGSAVGYAVVVAGFAALLVAALPALPVQASEVLTTPDERIALTRWTTTADWATGDADGLWPLPGSQAGVVMTAPVGRRDYTDPHTGRTATWEYSTWTSPVVEAGFGATELIASWNATTPHGTWIFVELQGRYDDGGTTPWYTMGVWSSDDTTIQRTSVEDQSDGRSSVLTDTVAVADDAGVRLTGYQLRLTLHRTLGSLATPRVWGLSVMASDVPDRSTVEPSAGGIAWGTELDVPRRSQNIHAGSYPEYGGGGEVWCSPTSTTMVMEFYGVHPSDDDLDWIEPGYTDPQVAHAARSTWDYAYEGGGNWPFNTAYATSFGGLDGFVTRLRSLDDLERLIAAGIPVVTSQSFVRGELEGAGYDTSGHLFVVVGFTDDGDVIVNDPAAPSNDAVRRVYPREQFEQVWLRTRRQLPDGGTAGGSGGIAYVIRPVDADLPDGIVTR
ncbi:peptidase C39 family protein [Jiangella asiatica]|uniref:Peptidase C39 family protein n=1 Tax=Jiangella asiatica TaxID=2530372 RepID=A0A4V2Z0J6_9ACTN|nr:peptidase C39 family protein [Jiangella asiatica]TDE01288.1 peptidase C39 family protein [Jiangella asiatica]